MRSKHLRVLFVLGVCAFILVCIFGGVFVLRYSFGFYDEGYKPTIFVPKDN